MTLLDILGRDVRVEWHEAVALVREVADQITGGGDPADIPELHQIHLFPDGSIEFHGGSAVNEPAQRVGHILQALLSRADPPVQLRLLISQPQESVQAFSEALAFFERPERGAILQGLYSRSMAALPLEGGETLAATLMPLPDSAAGDETHTDHPAQPHRKLLYIAALVTALGVLGAAGLYALRAEGDSAMRSDLGAKVSKSVSGVTAAVGSAVSAIGERVGLSGTAAEPVPVEAAKPLPQPAASSKPRRSAKTPPSKVAPQLDGALSAFDLDVLPRPHVAPDETIVIYAQPEGAGREPSGGSRESVVYDSRSKGVSPPEGLWPQLPKILPADVRMEDLTRIELDILPDGTVQSVKLVGDPQNIHAFMLLSAAKTWQFRPAMKDGVPVRYRKSVWVAR